MCCIFFFNINQSFLNIFSEFWVPYGRTKNSLFQVFCLFEKSLNFWRIMKLPRPPYDVQTISLQLNIYIYRYHNARKKKNKIWVHQQTNENGLSRWVRDQNIEWKLIDVLHMRVFICINFFISFQQFLHNAF